MSIFNDSFNHLSLDLAEHHKVEADFEICTFVFRVCFDRFIKTFLGCGVSGHCAKLSQVQSCGNWQELWAQQVIKLNLSLNLSTWAFLGSGCPSAMTLKGMNVPNTQLVYLQKKCKVRINADCANCLNELTQYLVSLLMSCFTTVMSLRV